MDGTVLLFTRSRPLSADPDSEAIARCRAGDSDAFAVIVDRYQTMVSSVVARSLRDPDDAADVVQEVFVRAYRALPSFRADARFSTWLYRIALNTAMRHAGAAARERQMRITPDPELPDPVEMLASDADQGPEATVWRWISHASLRNAVHRLPEKHRSVIILHFFEGKSCEETAEILGVSVGTVWSRIHYSVKKLRGSLKDAFAAE